MESERADKRLLQSSRTNLELIVELEVSTTSTQAKQPSALSNAGKFSSTR